MTRLYGRAPANERVIDYVPDVRFERTSVIGTLGLEGIIAPFTYEGTLNSSIFEVYVRDVLAKAMMPSHTLMLDHLSV